MKEKKQVLHARSKENGIIFYSNKSPQLCYEAYIDENGEVQARPQPSRYREEKDCYGMLMPLRSKNERNQIFAFKMVLLFFALISTVFINNVSITLAIFYFTIFAASDVVKFTNMVQQIKFGKFKATGRFHSAEHMVTKAYEKYKRVPTMLEIKKMSRFERYCGSRKDISKIVHFTLSALIIASYGYVSDYVYFGSAIILMVFSILEINFNLLRFLQIFVTNTPTEEELNVALAGIELFEELETHIPDHFRPEGIVFVEVVYDDSKNGDN